jgi:hypothetical protein
MSSSLRISGDFCGLVLDGGMDCKKTDGPTKQSVSLQALFSYHIDFDIYNDEGKRLYIPEQSQPPPLLMLWLIAAPD